MSDANIKAILDELGLLRVEIETVKIEISALKEKKIYIGDIGIGSFIGWVKLLVVIIIFISALLGTMHTFFSQIDVLRADYGAHLNYLHKSPYTLDKRGLNVK
jgi:hypothetical protein